MIALAAQFYIALFPVGGGDPSAENFFISYLAAPIVILFYFGYKVWDYKKTGRTQFYNTVKQMELTEGLRYLAPEVMEENRINKANTPKWKQVFKTFC